MISLTKENWRLIRDINASFNKSIKYLSDQEHYGKSDHWQIPTDGLGDCEDYALAKRHELSIYQIPSYIATCWTEIGGYHAVLIVHTDRGDFVLDNRYGYVCNIDELAYKWDKIQCEDGKWRSVRL